MTTVTAEFDGKVFVPQEQVTLPAGTKVVITLPTPPRALPAADKADWEDLMRKLNETEPYFSTVEEAIGYTRRRPGYYP